MKTDEPMTFCSGVVLNGKGELNEGTGYVAYADPTDRPNVHGSEIYVAALFPYNNVTIGKTPDNKNAVGMISNYTGDHITYYAGAGWSRYDIPNFEVWKLTVKQAMDNYKHPLTVTIK